jgi:hypothetical protein
MRLLCFALPLLGQAAGVEFVRVWPNYRDTESFERIGEYFGRPEDTGGEIVVRTYPDSRDGYYFLVRVKSSLAPSDTANARFELSVIRPDHPEPKTFTFPVALQARETVFQLGLTGPDWPGGKDAHPVAWKLVLRGVGNRVLTEHKSFLWEKPAK